MKKSWSLVMGLLVLGTFLTHAQSAIAGDSTRVQTKGVVLSGQVSQDGKTLLADDDNAWVVINADSLKGLEGRYVSVRCRMDVKDGRIRVLSVDQPVAGHSAHLGDAAFRR